MGFLLGDNSGQLSNEWVTDKGFLLYKSVEKFDGLDMVQVFVNIFSIEFFQDNFPQFIVLKIQSGRTNGNLSQTFSILNCENVQILNCDRNDN